MTMIGVGAEISIDEVTHYQMGRYASSNEAIWRIFSFPNHERRPTVVHLAVHLENGQRVNFTNKMYYVLFCTIICIIFTLLCKNLVKLT